MKDSTITKASYRHFLGINNNLEKSKFDENNYKQKNEWTNLEKYLMFFNFSDFDVFN